MNREEITKKILGITANFELSDAERLNNLIDLYSKLQDENNKLKSEQIKTLELIYDLLDEYDRELWENISYIDLADTWVQIVDESYKYLKKGKKSALDVSIVELGRLRRSMLLDYLKVQYWKKPAEYMKEIKSDENE